MKKIIVFALLAVVLAVSAMAASVEFKIEDTAAIQEYYLSEQENIYSIKAVANAEGGTFTGTEIVFTYDPTIFQIVQNPYDNYETLVDVTDIGDAVLGPVLSYKVSRGAPVIELASKVVLSAEVVDENNTKVTATYIDTSTRPASTDLAILQMFFRYADNKSADDITADSFKIVRVRYTDYALQTGFNSEDGSLAVTNNVVPAPETKLTIAVAAGDVVYLQDGTVVTIAEANEAYEIPTTAGTVVVNTVDADGVQTAQKVYTVADGAVTADTAKADGVLATNEASIRDDETASGIRYKSTFLTALKDAVDEYGYITTVESAHNALPADYVLDMALVDVGKAVKDEAYVKGTDKDIFWNVDGDKTVVTAVVTNVPMTKEGVTTNIVIRPYYMVGEFVVYGEPMTRTVYQVAHNIKENDAETYAKYQEYIDEILALCEEADVVIDFGPLFK